MLKSDKILDVVNANHKSHAFLELFSVLMCVWVFFLIGTHTCYLVDSAYPGRQVLFFEKIPPQIPEHKDAPHFLGPSPNRTVMPFARSRRRMFEFRRDLSKMVRSNGDLGWGGFLTTETVQSRFKAQTASIAQFPLGMLGICDGFSFSKDTFNTQIWVS
ncbi:hypothetical protein CEXT_215941 [Caerostris extrusa]|uniref:Uncharacterized protein n=1 Tax=Caerostris extrusa TaxID=172846 RepID=A0AAV4SVS1_CAEEX|nr:hypothetical protein CEXT_215941 [Caerostris extrusa]